MMLKYSSIALLLVALALSVSAQTWCGKNYMQNQPAVSPGGNFQVPLSSSTPLLAFRCAPAIKPYLPEDLHASSSSDEISPTTFIVDTYLVQTHINGAVPISLPLNTHPSALGSLSVTISIGSTQLAHGTVPLNTTGTELPFSLAALEPQHDAFDVQCSATYTVPGPNAHPQANVQKFSASTQLTYIPNPPIGSVTKMDLRTGAILARPVVTGVAANSAFQRLFPIGFYTSFGGYLDTNLTLLDEIKSQGFNIVHPIPTFDNLTALNEVLDHMEEVGLYLMYDMRFTYMNATSVAEQAASIQPRKNLLLWYTGDEPDGTSDPLNATSIARDYLTSTSAPSAPPPHTHPVSLVLNCKDYYYSEYAAGADVIMQDPYPIGINATFSVEWHTPCTEDLGCCGCDDCVGDFSDIGERVSSFLWRDWVEGAERGRVVWNVPQGFGSSEYWSRTPTGEEFVVESILSINHGARGLVSWTDPTTASIKSSASALAFALPQLASFILNPRVTFSALPASRFSNTQTGADVSAQTTANAQFVDTGVWTLNGEVLLLVTNTGYTAVEVRLANLGVSIAGGLNIEQVFDSGAKVSGSGTASDVAIELQQVGSGAFIVRKA